MNWNIWFSDVTIRGGGFDSRFWGEYAIVSAPCEPLATGISFSAGWFSFVSEAFLHIVEKVSIAFIILPYINFRIEVPIHISHKCMNVLGCLKTTDWITQLLCNSTGYNRPHSILVENLDKKTWLAGSHPEVGLEGQVRTGGVLCFPGWPGSGGRNALRIQGDPM